MQHLRSSPPIVHLARLLAAALALSPATASTAQVPDRRPNIVLIVLDDVGMSDLGAFGGEIATPVMDGMAKAGMRFTNFHVAAACSPTRAMLYTGVDNHLAGVGTLENVIADNQKGKPGYEGYLNDRVVSIGTLLSNAGYRTYFSGKWNLGDTVDKSPATHGFQKSVALAETGSDNYESKPYAPIHEQSHWYEAGKEIALPKDFYSTRYYVERMIGWLQADQARSQPFFSVVALQANHYPHQAPKPFIDRYMGRYDAGWDTIRAERHARQIKMGLFPAGPAPRTSPHSVAWSSLAPQQQRDFSRRMAVYAGMLDAADTYIGRFRDYLKASGQFDNTVFIVLSDNGADPYRLDKVFWYWYPFNYATNYEALGEKGAFSAYGQDWAQVSNTPGYLFKGNAGEGGTRTPLFVSWPARFRGGRISDRFAHVKDLVPTMLELAGAAVPGRRYQGRTIAVPDGTSLVAHLDGRSERVHAPEEAIGYEVAGNAALYKGDLKLVKDMPPYGDDNWHLYDVRRDPAESSDLQHRLPTEFRAMQADMQAYLVRHGVIALPPNYNVIQQLVKNNWRILLKMLWPLLLTMLVLLAAAAAGLAWLLRRRRKAKA